MREATLNDMSALDAVRPRRPRPPAGKPGKAAKTGSFGARFRRFRARATLVIGSLGFSAIMVGIICNAVLFQKGHHPAPLFGSAATGDVPLPAPPPAARLDAPPPAARPVVEPTADAPPAAALPAPAAAPAPARHAAHAPAPLHPSRVAAVPHHAAAPKLDGIARLLGQHGATTAASHPAAHVRPGQTSVARATDAAGAVKKARPAALAAKDRPASPATATN